MTTIVKAVQVALQADPGIQTLVAAPYIGEDAGYVNGWIFDYTLKTRLENSQRCAIVVNSPGGWSVPNRHNTARFPLVVVDIWADPTRNDDHSQKYEDADDKLKTIYDAVFKVLHQVNPSSSTGGALVWDDLTIISSEALDEPDISPVTGGNGAKMLRARFGVTY